MKLCEEAEGDKAIPAELYDADGELDEAHIFCAKCLDKESFDVSTQHISNPRDPH